MDFKKNKKSQEVFVDKFVPLMLFLLILIAIIALIILFSSAKSGFPSLWSSAESETIHFIPGSFGGFSIR